MDLPVFGTTCAIVSRSIIRWGVVVESVCASATEATIDCASFCACDETMYAPIRGREYCSVQPTNTHASAHAPAKDAPFQLKEYHELRMPSLYMLLVTDNS